MKIIFFDGFCVLCNNFLKWVIVHDPEKKFKFSMIGGEEYKKLEAAQPKVKTVDSVILLDGEKVYMQGEAVRKIIQDLSSFSIVKSAVKITPLFLLDFYYSFIAKIRYKIFGKYDVCPPMPPEWRDRFLP